jgi:hypothetical protein
LLALPAVAPQRRSADVWPDINWKDKPGKIRAIGGPTASPDLATGEKLDLAGVMVATAPR